MRTLYLDNDQKIHLHVVSISTPKIVTELDEWISQCTGNKNYRNWYHFTPLLAWFFSQVLREERVLCLIYPSCIAFECNDHGLMTTRIFVTEKELLGSTKREREGGEGLIFQILNLIIGMGKYLLHFFLRRYNYFFLKLWLIQ